MNSGSFESWVSDNFKKLIDIRRWLHRNPEIGFDEHKTSEYLKKLLLDSGYTITQTPEMKTGFFCEYNSGSNGSLLAVRCDMDGLLVSEQSSKEYKSINKGVMHACGHDVHMTTVVGLAIMVSELKLNISGSIRFIFQPAEEQAPGGSIAMIDGGAIENVNHIIGGHVLPKMDAGKLGFKAGPMAAIVELIEISITGPGGHTSRPAETVDLIWAMSQLILSMEQSVRRSADQQQPVVLAFGKVVGGNTFNVLPDSIELKGTLRYLDSDLKNKLHSNIDKAISGVEQVTGAKIKWSVPYTSPGVFNDESLTDVLVESSKKAIGSNSTIILEESSMGGEDFAYYLEHIPGSYYRIGCYDGCAKDVHTPNFDVDESCISTAVLFLGQAIVDYFNQ
tara:strand:- start:926 stop:2101 length:1176 start_codon:yes stop_codon:yes gene_type:complete